MREKYQQLLAKLQEIDDIQMAASVLNWDQTTYMPPGGAEARGRQIATLGRLAQEKFVDPAIGRLLDELQPWAEMLPPDSDETAMLRVARRDYDQATRVPPAFLGEFYGHMAQTYQVWTEARPASDFGKVRPLVEKTLDYSRRLAEFFAPYDHIIDPLIDMADYGMKAATVSALFAELRHELVPLVQAITRQPAADDACLHLFYPEKDQETFGIEVARAMGYDFARGRLDKTHHPFTTKFSLGDVRITTRYDEHNFGDAFFSTVHEAGHAMYEQGIDRAYDGTPLGGGTSSGVHESQSRTWENIVGRSRAFWNHYYPVLKQRFPAQLEHVSLDTFYRAINKVEKSLVRVDADEVTYNLHVMLRFDFEMALLEGKLAVKDLPEAWNERFRQDFGILPPDDRLGCLQDVHWYGGNIGGAFQGYTLGNILSALFYEQALKALPGIPGEIEQGKFGLLHGWLVENIYRYGRIYTASELVKRISGGPVRIAPYIQYLKHKYGELYAL
jgi:carboxypeptidase Taq